jgi:hypothetical protein
MTSQPCGNQCALGTLNDKATLQFREPNTANFPADAPALSNAVMVFASRLNPQNGQSTKMLA